MEGLVAILLALTLIPLPQMTFDAFCDKAQDDEVRESQEEEDRLGLYRRLRPGIEEANDGYANEIDDVGRPRTRHSQIPAVVRGRLTMLPHGMTAQCRWTAVMAPNVRHERHA